MLPGVLVRPVSFRPTFDKFAGEACNGVMIHVTDPSAFRPVTTYLTLIALARAQAPDALQFRTRPYEFVQDIPAFDLLTGSSDAREALLSGATPNDVVDRLVAVPPEWRERVLECEARILERASA